MNLINLFFVEQTVDKMLIMQTRAYIYLTKDIPYRGEFEFPKLKTNVLDKSNKSLFIPSKRTSGNYLQCHQL